MESEYSITLCKNLHDKFNTLGLHRPMRIDRYDAGDSLTYEVTSVTNNRHHAQIHLSIEKFVGGGFAGQVYKVRLDSIEGDPIDGLSTGQTYAMKILIPPSHFSVWFRNFLYGLGFQGAFQLQCNPAAARSGAIWQKFIRRGARIRFGDDQAVNDIHATFIEETLGSCGELSNWVDGRTWRLEVDERLDLLNRWKKGETTDNEPVGSPEYRTKKQFMADFVKLLHDMGAHEFARQYEWSTWKSQPNSLKRNETDNDPFSGLIAVDFRAGLALLPFLPMSPGDVKLIFQGLGRGSLVQFDRGSVKKLEAFINTDKDAFPDMQGMLEELKSDEHIYRNSVPDITHNHFRLFYSKTLWSTMLASSVTGWKVRNIIDTKCESNLRKNNVLTLIFILIGILPFLGKFIRRIWGRVQYRKHYASLLTNGRYFLEAIHAKMIEKSITWHRAGRMIDATAVKTAHSFIRFLVHIPFSFLPAGLHKFLTNWSYFKEHLDYILIRPVRLYFDEEEREAWFRDMVDEGKKKYIVTDSDAQEILSQMKEPFIQKYLKSLAVHVCTVPITQVVSVAIAAWYILAHPDLPWEQAWATALTIIAAFQVVPISPGSLTRGLYVLFLVIRERNFKDYNIAVFLGFFKYIGYLAFPIQMTYRYPTIARFMAGYWATEAVHVVPVFGEGGALLEHSVFYLFYNWPLTIRRRIIKRIEKRAQQKPRYWHAGLYTLLFAGLFSGADYLSLTMSDQLPGMRDIWWCIAVFPFAGGVFISIGCGGSSLWKRIITAVFAGMATGVLYTAASTCLGYDGTVEVLPVISLSVWRMFAFSVISAVGALITELR